MPLEEQSHRTFMGWPWDRPQGVDMGCSLVRTATKGRALQWICVGVDLQDEDARPVQGVAITDVCLVRTATKGRALQWVCVGVDLQSEDASPHKARPLL